MVPKNSLPYILDNFFLRDDTLTVIDCHWRKLGLFPIIFNVLFFIRLFYPWLRVLVLEHSALIVSVAGS
ncbi:hypothetical protein DASC09_034030 [Saccharomycopsis crataegensis]|uniref:Uncharacterized protein n=1 Tax=Saccharomycopsis crataegensis TaxID=43959 RepID=A0AAV5QMI3_9ASCO|nr:hypothetical protein DASC09_034030 [Saccharomycopsis crataegensis]